MLTSVIHFWSDLSLVKVEHSNRSLVFSGATQGTKHSSSKKYSHVKLSWHTLFTCLLNVFYFVIVAVEELLAQLQVSFSFKLRASQCNKPDTNTTLIRTTKDITENAVHSYLGFCNQNNNYCSKNVYNFSCIKDNLVGMTVILPYTK